MFVNTCCQQRICIQSIQSTYMNQQGKENKRKKCRTSIVQERKCGWPINISEDGQPRQPRKYELLTVSQACTCTHIKQGGNCKSWWEHGARGTVVPHPLEDQCEQSLCKGSPCGLEKLNTCAPYLYQGYTLEELLHMWTRRCAQKCSLEYYSESSKTNYHTNIINTRKLLCQL